MIPHFQRRLPLSARRRPRRRRRQRSNLRIIIATVSGERQIESIQRPLGEVLPDAKRRILIWRKTRHLRPPGPRSGSNLGGRPAVRMVQRDVPRAFTAHGKPAQQNTAGIDLVSLPHRSQSLEYIHLTRVMPASAVPSSVQVELDLAGIGNRRLRRPLVREVEQEIGFRQTLGTPVHPDIQPAGLRAIVGSGHRSAIRLDRTIERGMVPVDTLDCRCPRRVSVL